MFVSYLPVVFVVRDTKEEGLVMFPNAAIARVIIILLMTLLYQSRLLVIFQICNLHKL